MIPPVADRLRSSILVRFAFELGCHSSTQGAQKQGNAYHPKDWAPRLPLSRIGWVSTFRWASSINSCC